MVIDMKDIEEQLRIINERLELLEKAAISNNYWAYKRILNKVDCQSNREIDHLYAELNTIPIE